MSIVLFDGSQPAVKALEAGCAPSFFNNHTKNQLVVIHATKPKPSIAAAADHYHSSNTNDDAHHHHQDSSATTNTSGPNPYTVIPMVSELINKNRHASSSLNYKTETFRMFTGPPISPQEERQREHDLQLQLQQQQQANTKGSKSVTAPSAVTLLNDPENMAGSSSNASSAAQQQYKKRNSSVISDYSLQSNFADCIAARARHHNLRTVLLGVGSSGGHGKALSIGSYSRAVIDRLRGDPENTGIDVVGIFKPSGPPVRATQPIRVTLIVTPETTIDQVKNDMLKNLPYLSQSRGDYVSLFVIMNDGKAKPLTLTNTLKEIEATRQQQITLGQQNVKTMPTSEEQLDLIDFEKEDELAQQNNNNDDETSATGQWWKSQVQKVRQLAQDVSSLGFLNQEEKIKREKEEAEERERELAATSADQQQQQQQMAATASVAGSGGGFLSGFEGPSLLNCFWIEPTNRDPSPSLESHTGCIQLSKGLGGLKTDYAVVASESISGVGESATNALLSANRPHVLLM